MTDEDREQVLDLIDSRIVDAMRILDNPSPGLTFEEWRDQFKGLRTEYLT